MLGKDRAYRVKSAQRVLELLEFFAECRRPSTVKEISNALRYPQSSTSILLKSLNDLGFFDHDPRTGMYSPNIRVALATAWIGEQLFSEKSLLRLMEQVQEACGHMVMIGKLDGLRVRYLHVLHTPKSAPLRIETGSLWPLFRSASGRMLLATLTESEMRLMLRNANAMEEDSSQKVSEEEARRLRNEALRQGYAVSHGSSTPGASALAILLPVPRSSAPLTLCVGGPTKEIKANQEELLAIMRKIISPLNAVVR